MSRKWSRWDHASPLERFWSHVEKTGTCWLWTAAISPKGYGQFAVGGASKHRPAHIWIYETLVGLIPAGLEIDHLCHNADADCRGGPNCRHRRCCNPAHLEPVTTLENQRRSSLTFVALNAAKTHCPHGHPYSSENTYYIQGARQCRECNRIACRLRNAGKPHCERCSLVISFFRGKTWRHAGGSRAKGCGLPPLIRTRLEAQVPA